MPPTIRGAIGRGHQTPPATGKELTLTLEINATSDGFDTRNERIVKENVTQLGFESHEFET